MKYLRIFSTIEEYNSAKSGLPKPNVSLIADSNKVMYIEPNPIYEYVDLGLPSGTLWAKHNIGATSETEYGDYFQYGKGADDYTVTSGQSDYSGYEIPLAESADTAAVLWGGSWHQPTQSQLEELISNTTYSWVNNYNESGVNGCKFKAKDGSGNYIFIPAGGYWAKGFGNSRIGNESDIWSSTIENMSTKAYYGYFNSSGRTIYDGKRSIGVTIRPVIG